MKDGQNLSLQAVITGSNGEPLDAWAYTKFRERTPKLTEFTMLYNGKTYDLLAGKQYNLTFILEHFHGAHPFEFRVKYTETDVIESVIITSTRNGRKESLKAVYDTKKDMYVAKGYFNDENHDYVPGIIGVEYQRHTPEKSLEQISEEMDKLSQNPLLRNAEIDVVENQDSHKVLNATFEDCGSLQYVFDSFTALEFIEEYLETYPEEAEPIIRRYLETHPVGSAKSQSEAVGASASGLVGGGVGLIDSLIEYPDTNLTELVIEFFDAASESRAIDENTDIYLKKTKDPNGKISIWRVVIGETNVNGLFREVIMPEAADLYETIITKIIKASGEEGAEILADGFSDMFAVDQFALDLSGSGIGFLEDLYGEGIKLSYTEFTDEDVRKFTDHVKESLENLTCEIIGSALEAAGGFLVGECPPLGLACWAIGHFIGNDYKDNRDLFNNMFTKFDKAFTQLGDRVRSFFKNVFSFTIDPSGYVYAAVTDNRVAGATVTAYWIPYDENDEDYWTQPDESKAVIWDSNEYNQVNPDVTDDLGNYAWDVPEGWWRVEVEKEGYETYTTEWLPVPPPQIDVNINLMSKAVPEIACTDITDSAVVLTFSEYVDPDTLGTLTLTNVQGNSVPFVLAYDHNSTDLNGKVSAKEVSLVFGESYVPSEDFYTVSVNNAESYAGVSFSAAVVVSRVIGDANADGKVNINDVTAIQCHLADVETLTGSIFAADANGDGNVTIEDATHLQMYLAEYDVVLGK